MAMTLYELLGADDRRFSPFCWRSRLALAHKGFDADRVGVRFCDKELVAFSGQKLVPVLVDGETVVSDSWDIACYLDDAYPDRPALFGGDAARPLAHFINTWADYTARTTLTTLIVFDIFNHIEKIDWEYFRSNREQRYGMTLEEVQKNRDRDVAVFRAALQPIRSVLESRPYIAGAAPAYADYILLGTFLFARTMSPFKLLEDDDPVYAWRARMLDLFDGMARKAVGYAC